MHDVHISGSGALYAACESQGIRRGILLSAIGANRDTPSVFSGTKRQGEAALTSRGLNWVVLRPSVVMGSGAYAGYRMALRRCRFCQSCPTRRPFDQCIWTMLSKTIAFFSKPNALSRIALCADSRGWSHLGSRAYAPLSPSLLGILRSSIVEADQRSAQDAFRGLQRDCISGVMRVDVRNKGVATCI
jgi:nucleoside-diphosphate-sugar epimerase